MPYQALLSCGTRSATQAEQAAAWAAREEIIRLQLEERLAQIAALTEDAEKEQDVLKKATLLAEVRRERAAIAASVKGCSDVAGKLDLVLDFLSDLSEGLANMTAQVERLSSSVDALHSKMDGLLGRPVLNVVSDAVEKELTAERTKLEQHVYIPVSGIVSDERNHFEVSEGNPPFDMMADEKNGLQAFLMDRIVNVDPAHDFAVGDETTQTGLLPPAFSQHPSVCVIGGAAGSGKSTLMEKLLRYLRTEYRARRAEERPECTLVILSISLGALTNPLTDLFNEGLKRQYRLNDYQASGMDP